MKITREININGVSTPVEYDLTGIELERCFNEIQHRKDWDTVIAQLEKQGYEDIDGIPEATIEELTTQLRDKANTMMEDFAEHVIEVNEDELKPYKEKWKVYSKEVTLTLTKTYTVRAKNEEDADRIFDEWSENHGGTIENELFEEIYNGDWDIGDAEEEDDTLPDYADIMEDD